MPIFLKQKFCEGCSGLLKNMKMNESSTVVHLSTNCSPPRLTGWPMSEEEVMRAMVTLEELLKSAAEVGGGKKAIFVRKTRISPA